MATKNRPSRIRNQAARCIRVVKPLRADTQQKGENSEILSIKRHLDALPSCEPWLDNNPEAKASVERGLQQAARGEIHDLGSFSQYADLEIDD